MLINDKSIRIKKVEKMIDLLKETFIMKIFREDFNFSAGHISIYHDNIESLHGHNYYVTVEIKGYLTEDFILIDFKKIKDILGHICKNLNHLVLIPTLNSELKITQNEEYTKIVYKDKYIELPTSDALCLELPNLSCEMLAYYIFEKMQTQLKQIDKDRFKKILIEVMESAGQSASFEGEI